MSDFNLIYTAIQTLATQSEAQYTSILQRLDHINGTVRRHDVDLTSVTVRQETCQKHCLDCIERLEPIVQRLDDDMRVAKKIGKVLAIAVSALLAVLGALAGFF